MNIQTLSAAKLEAAIEKQDAICRDAVDRMIDAGRGHETFSDIRKASDLLSLHYCAAMNLSSAMNREKEARLRYHGSLKPIRKSA